MNSIKDVFIIAEIGVNHNGSTDTARKMIKLASDLGADAVKFQTFNADTLAHSSTPKTKYQKLASPNEKETHYEMLKNLQLTYDQHFVLKEYSDSLSIEFISTPYDIESARFLNEELKVKKFKTASADIIDLPLHNYIASTCKHSFVSTGMATLGEIEKVVDIYKLHDPTLKNVSLLHCTSNYPCSPESVNLLAMNTLYSSFRVPVGFSDHTQGHVAAIMSVGFGASVIEKHFTLDPNSEGPDHKASLCPQDLSQYIKSIRLASRSLGHGRKECQPEELDMKLVSRKSIFVKHPLKAGDTITDYHLCLKRPGSGLPSEFLQTFIGKKCPKDLEIGHKITLDDFFDS